jgi:CDP-paratose 2-epimerase
MHSDGDPYRVFGYKSEQLRDNIHSYDLVNAFHHFYMAPRVAEVYNIDGARFSARSMLEAIELCEKIAGKALRWTYEESTGSATTSGGSATCESSRAIIRDGT